MSIKINDKRPKCYIVMGSGGSATSFITKALMGQGVDMSPDDEEVYENKEFVNVNNDLIQHKDVPGKIKSTIRKFGGDFWGWKDPRTAFTLDKWLPYLEHHDVYLVCMFRKPGQRQRKGLKEHQEKVLEQVRKFLELDGK